MPKYDKLKKSLNWDEIVAEKNAEMAAGKVKAAENVDKLVERIGGAGYPNAAAGVGTAGSMLVDAAPANMNEAALGAVGALRNKGSGWSYNKASGVVSPPKNLLLNNVPATSKLHEVPDEQLAPVLDELRKHKTARVVTDEGEFWIRRDAPGVDVAQQNLRSTAETEKAMDEMWQAGAEDKSRWWKDLWKDKIK